MRFQQQKRRAAVAVLVAVCLIAILGVVAIALDGGLMLDNRRRVQAATDAAALAAATELYSAWSTNMGLDTTGAARTSALYNAAMNGYNDDKITSIVTVTFSPGVFQGGPNAGTPIQPGHVEVIIQYNQKRSFSSIFGSSDLPVTARAVARGKASQGNSGVGILLLNPVAQGALTITGSAAMKVKGRVVVDSNHTKAAVSSGSASLTSNTMDITGNYTSSSTSFFRASDYPAEKPLTGVAPIPDFLAQVPVPNPLTMPVRSASQFKPTSGQVLQPGVYIGGISISSQPNVIFSPGIYYLQGGGLVMSGGSSSFTALGVMFYNGIGSNGSTGKITVSGGGKVVQSPLDSGPWAGMSIFQDRTSTQPITLSGGSGWDFTGTVYAAKALVSVTGGSGANMGSQYISDTLSLTGSSTFNDIDPSKGYRQPERDLRLIE